MSRRNLEGDKCKELRYSRKILEALTIIGKDLEGISFWGCQDQNIGQDSTA